MSKNYSDLLNTTQKQPIFGRTDMIKNNASGYVFKISQQEQLERFLLCGTIGGTYYVKESKLTVDNANEIVSYIKTNGLKVLETVSKFVSERRLLKQDTAIFVLALTTTYGDAFTKTKAYSMINEVCKTGTHLFTFLSEIQNLRGWSSGLRKGVANWYTQKDINTLGYQIVKYRERKGFTHKDALRLSHPKAINNHQNELFKYIVGKENQQICPIVIAYESAKHFKDNALIELINSSKLTWEMIPTSELNNPEVLKALLPNMPLMALLRNLNRFSKANLTDGMTKTTQEIITKLVSQSNVEKSGIHPIAVLNSMRTYSNGRGDLGSSAWNVNQRIVDALNETFELSFKNLESSGKKILVAVDVSGSMDTPAAGTKMSCKEIGAVMGSITLKTELLSELIWFDTQLYNTNFGSRTSYDFILKNTPHGGGTDCSLPLLYALEKGLFFDAIVIYTDSETWAGKKHALGLIETYRAKINKDVKIIEIAMASNPYTLLPEDKNFLRIVGYDANIPQLINEFVKN